MSGKGVINFYQGAERNANLRALKTMLERALAEAQRNAQQLGSLGATAQGIEEGAEPTVQVTQDENGIHIHFGIPAGPQGNAFRFEDFTPEQLEELKGPPGKDFQYEDFTPEQLEALRGRPGVSPTVQAEPIEGGTRVSITDAAGTKTFEVRDGEDGYTPIKGKDYNDGNSIESIERTSGTGAPGTTDTYTVTLTDGSKTTFQVYNGADGEGAGDMTSTVYDPQGKAQDIFKYAEDLLKTIDASSIVFSDGQTWQQKYDAGEFKGKDGDDGYTPVKGKDYFDGEKGDPGYTPVKGTDYWTAADKAEMVADVLAALPSAEGVSY